MKSSTALDAEALQRKLESYRLSSSQKQVIKNHMEMTPELIIRAFAAEKVDSAWDIYQTVRSVLRQSGAEEIIATQLALWVFDNLDTIILGTVSRTKNLAMGFQASVKALGLMMQRVDWVVMLSAMVGGLVLGGVAVAMGFTVQAVLDAAAIGATIAGAVVVGAVVGGPVAAIGAVVMAVGWLLS